MNEKDKKKFQKKCDLLQEKCNLLLKKELEIKNLKEGLRIADQFIDNKLSNDEFFNKIEKVKYYEWLKRFKKSFAFEELMNEERLKIQMQIQEKTNKLLEELEISYHKKKYSIKLEGFRRGLQKAKQIQQERQEFVYVGGKQ